MCEGAIHMHTQTYTNERRDDHHEKYNECTVIYLYDV